MFLEHKVNEAIEFLKENEPPEGYDIKFSGGKDSIVMYDIVKRSGVKYTIYYNFTTIDPPEVTRFILKNYPEVVWLRPKKNFFQYLLQIGLPTKVKRWCCTKLKHRIHDGSASRHKVLGIRAEESKKRAERGQKSEFLDGKKTVVYSPIFYFTESDVWDYIDANSLAYPSLYDEGFSRIGCVICPYICRSGGVLEMHKKKWPQLYKKFEEVVAEYFNKKISFYKSVGIFSVRELLDKWYTSQPIGEDKSIKKQETFF